MASNPDTTLKKNQQCKTCGKYNHQRITSKKCLFYVKSVRFVQIMHLRCITSAYGSKTLARGVSCDEIDTITDVILARYPDLDRDRTRRQVRLDQWLGARLLKLKKHFGWSLLFFDFLTTTKIRDLRNDFEEYIEKEIVRVNGITKAIPNNDIARDGVLKALTGIIGDTNTITSLLNNIDSV